MSDANKTRESEQPEKWSFDLQNYVVLFLDVLGQKEEIFRFHLVPDDETLGRDVVLGTAGFVRELRDLVNVVLAPKQDTQFIQSLPADEQEKLKKATRSEVRVSQTLSDALVVSTPVGPDPDDFTVVANGIRWALVTSSWIQLRALEKRHAIRGGMDVGWGVISDN